MPHQFVVNWILFPLSLELQGHEVISPCAFDILRLILGVYVKTMIKCHAYHESFMLSINNNSYRLNIFIVHNIVLKQSFEIILAIYNILSYEMA